MCDNVSQREKVLAMLFLFVAPGQTERGNPLGHDTTRTNTHERYCGAKSKSFGGIQDSKNQRPEGSKTQRLKESLQRIKESKCQRIKESKNVDVTNAKSRTFHAKKSVKCADKRGKRVKESMTL